MEIFQDIFQSHSIFSLQLILISRTWIRVISAVVFRLISKSKWKVNIDYYLLINREDSSGIDFERCFIKLFPQPKIISAISVLKELFMDNNFFLLELVMDLIELVVKLHFKNICKSIYAIIIFFTVQENYKSAAQVLR